MVVPPITVTVAFPSDAPLQRALLLIVAVAVRMAGSEIITLAVAEQPFASVTVAVFMPAANAVAIDVVSPLLHR